MMDESSTFDTSTTDTPASLITPDTPYYVTDGQRLIELQSLRDRAVGDGLLSEDEAVALLEPEITLLVNEREESQAAFSVLEQAHVSFRVVPSLHSQRPHTLWGDTTFDGLKEIQALAETLQEIDAGLDKGIEQHEHTLFAQRDSRLSQWLEEVYQQRLAEARQVMARTLEYR